MADSDAVGPISETLWASWMEWQNASLYATWRRDNPGEDDKLRAYWNHGGDPPVLATATGKAYVLEAQSYWGVMPIEKKLYVGPLGKGTAARLAVPAYEHPQSWNGWASVDLRCEKGEPIYAVEDGKIPNVYADNVDTPVAGAVKVPYDGSVSKLRWGYAHVTRSGQYEKLQQGEQIGTCAGETLHFCGSNFNELMLLVYST